MLMNLQAVLYTLIAKSSAELQKKEEEEEEHPTKSRVK